jgi:hypothetical protein
MNVKLLIDKVLADPLSQAQPSSILTTNEIMQDPYLVSAYYHKSPYIRLVTPQHLIGTTIAGKNFPKVKREVDIPDYVYDHIVETGRALIFVEPFSEYAVIKQFNEKRFLTFGAKRAIPFGLSNFIQPRYNLLNISTPFTFGTPILIVEGLRDLCDAQYVYPFTVCTQTDTIPTLTQQVLHTLTDTIILGLDNDKPGSMGTAKLLRYHQFNYRVLQYPPSIKDVGTLSQLYFKDTFLYRYYLEYLIQQLKLLST